MPESNIYSSLSAALPNELTFSIQLDAGSDPDASYVDITIKDDPGTENVLEGMNFDGYCIDTDRGIRPNIDYTAKVYSSYETLPDELIGTGLIEKPENLDLVNWILNQGFEGQASTGNGTYTSGDIQRAVWSLLDDQQSSGGGTLGAWEQARVDEILDLAQDNGEGFVPEYDYTTIFGEQVVGKMGVILVPDSNNDGLPDSQIVIAEVELSKIGDTVWSDCDADGIQDGNEAGMAGVTVNLLTDVDGDGVIEDGEVVDTTTTDANGNYEFTTIAGDYKVQFEQPDNKLISPANQGGDDTVDSDGLVSDVVTLDPGENDTTVDAGFYHPPSFKAALPGMLTFSIQLDAGSDPDASYVDITIKDIPGTDNIFEGMTFDGYCLDTDRPINRNVDYTAKVYSSGEPLPDELIGPGLIEKPENLDLVNWILNQNFEGKDSNGNGTYTSGDVQRAIWELIDDQQSNGGGSLGAWNQDRVAEILAEAQSNGEGFVPSYDYTTIFGEQIVGKFGLILVPDTDGDCLPDKQIVIAEVELSKLGDTVWLDSDADGIQDAGEAGIADVTVNLFADIDGDGVFEESELVETTTTDANGNYEFSVMAGEYQVQFEQPDGFEVSPANQGGDDTVDSDGLVSDIVSLAPGENNPTIDSGFYELASLGDKVFEDTNGNGIQDAGENGVAGVEVKLQDANGNPVLDNNGDPITTTTDANGEYSFTGLTPGEYKVMFVAPDGYIFSPQDAGGDDGLDSDANPSNGMTQTVTLESGEINDTLDAGLLIPNPGIDIEKFVNEIDVTDLNNLPEIAAGEDVTFTYEVTNTGNVGFSTSEVIVSDDNGTVGDTSDDFTPTLDLSTDVGSDGILSPGETWVYSSATEAAQDLSSSTTSDIRFLLTGSSSLDGANGNVRTFTKDGVSVDVSAFSQKWGTWKNAYLGAYSGGLGVTNRDEGTSSHRVDNSWSTDYILFEFDQDVTVDKAFLDYVGWDSDMSIWIGDRDGADISHLNDSLLDSFTKENNFTHHGRDRWADFNDAGLTGDTVVISAYTHGSNDSFKLKKLDVSVTETSFGEYQNVATVQADTVSDSDTSGYVNPTPNPGIDIEKFVNEIDVTDLNNLPEIAAGEDVTFTYEVTNTGNVGFSTSEVIVSDDNGTVGDTSDDFTPTLDLSTDVGSDGILSPGETWVYSSATEAAQDLSSSTTSDIRFLLTGSSSLDGANGNVRTFTKDGVSVDVSAFSQKWGTWKNAYLGAYSGGLGVTNRDEGTSSHRVDNSWSTDYILFEFDQDVTVDKAFLDYVGWDSDMSIWIGDRDGADISHLNDSLLDSFTKENNFTHHGRDRWADFNDAGLTGDTVVISAYTHGSNDSFKLKKLDVSVTETSFGEYQNVATVQADTVSDSDTSGYVNPTDTASTSAHILIEAEDMHLNDYQTEHENFASGGELIKLSDHSGYASTTFDGETGTYNVIVGYYDENDGQADAKVKIGGDVLDYWTFDQDLASHLASPDNFVTRQVGNDVHIENGDTIKLFGWEDGNEYARFDYIKLVNTDAATNAAAADEITGTSGVDELVGTDADETLVGYASWDLLTGGGGADKFVFTSLNDRRDQITDFEVGADVIDVSQVLDAIGYVGNDPISDGYVQLGSNSYGAVVSVDQDGFGDDYDPVALVEMANANVNSLSASHFIF